MFGKKKKITVNKRTMPIRSTSNDAKRIIRAEIARFYSPKRKGEGKSALENMQRAANSYSEGRGKSDANKGAALVDAGCFAVYEQDEMLSKIYGKEVVKNWDNEKRHNTYRNLIGREYAAMLAEREVKKRQNADKKIKADIKKAAEKGIKVIKPGTEIATDNGIYHLVINPDTGKYSALLQPYEEWKGQRIPSNKGWKTVKTGSLRECSSLIEKAK